MGNILEKAQQIAQSSNSTIFLSTENDYHQPVIVKRLNAAHNFYPYISQVANEDNLLQDLNIKGVRSSLGTITIDGEHSIVLKYFQGITIKEFCADNKASIRQRIVVAINICNSLSQIHQNNIIHKDLNSHNILISPEDLSINIIDFGIATKLKMQTEYLGNPEHLEGTLQYISPEQTGRVNRPIDYQSDIYSLGVTLYELFTSQLPFDMSDPMELIHAHLAHLPNPPNKVNNSIPDMLSEIVMKLLAKSANDRYQSVLGLATDLQVSLKQIDKGTSSTSFILGENDFSSRFQIPNKLYGREKETAALLGSFDRVAQNGKPEVVLVTGHSGAGKSSIIKEIHKSIALQKGIFLSGKFEQYHRDTPYLAISQAFKGLVDLILTESEDVLLEWKCRIEKAVGIELSLLLHIIPELSKVVGSQPQTSIKLSTNLNGMQHSFNYAFLRFIKAISNMGNTLTLFIDDLQWADLASLNLIKVILTDDNLSNVLFIGAYRDNETDETHPMTTTFSEIGKNPNHVIHKLKINNLDYKNVEELVSEALKCSSDQCTELSEEVYNKTQGNPFFVNQFLYSLNDRGLVFLEKSEGSIKNNVRQEWAWNLNDIKSLDFTDNVVDLLSSKIKEMTAEAQEVLTLAACIGNRFDLKSLTHISNKPVNKVVMSLWVALIERLITPVGNNISFVHANLDMNMLDLSRFEYKFTHDRIQQAAYSFIPEESKQEVHYKIGKLLLSNLNKEERKAQVFEIIFHLNKSFALIQDESIKSEVVELNFLAGKRAKNSSAYHTALALYERIPELVTEEIWKEKYAFALELYNQLAESAYLCGNYEKLNHYKQIIIENSEIFLDQIAVHQIFIHSYIARNRSNEAIETGMWVLNRLKVKFPAEPNNGHIVLGLIKTQILLKLKKFETLETLPIMTNPEALAIMHIIGSFGSVAYRSSPKLFPLVVFKLIQLSMKYGNASESIPTYGGYGIIQSSLGNIDEASAYGQLSYRMLDKYDSRLVKSRTYIVINTFISFWKNHVRETLEKLKESYDAAMELGDLEFAAASLMMHSFHSYVIGEPLGLLKTEITNHEQKIKRLNQELLHLHIQIFRQSILNLSEDVENPTHLLGFAFDETNIINNPEDSQFDHTAFFYTYYNKLILCCVFEEYEEGYEYAKELENKLERAVSTIFMAQYHFYDSLCRLGHYPNCNKKEQKSIIKRVKSNQKKMKKWAAHAPMNFEQFHLLIEIQLQCVLLPFDEGLNIAFDKVITLSLEHDYLNIASMSCELAGKYYLNNGQASEGDKYTIKAYNLYSRWGAYNKVNQIKSNYPNIMSSSPTNRTAIKSITSSTSILQSLDLSSILKATEAISKEIKLESVSKKLIQILMQNAGAQKGSFIIKQNGSLSLYAQSNENQEIEIIEGDLHNEKNLVPVSLVHYVIRTRETVVIDDISSNKQFLSDEYFKHHTVLSAICSPVVHQDNVIGLIYLENNLIRGAFTEQRLEMLKLLSGQIAITVHNSLLYQNLEQKVQERTEEIEAQKKNLKDKNKQLEVINEDKNQLLDVVSHDLRSPLNQIKGLANLIELDATNGITPEQKEYIDNITESCDRLNGMITNILDISAIEAQEIELKLENVNIGDLLDKVINDHSVEVLDKKISIAHNKDKADTLIVLDENYAFQAFSNILSNAIKFSEKDQQVEINVTQNSKSVVIEIKDFGPGISKGDQKNLFKKFQKLSAKPTAGESSIGLGLSIVKKYIEAMHGTISIKSELEKGTSFFIEFDKISI